MNFETRDLNHKPEYPDDLFENHDIIALAETHHGEHDKEILDFLEKFSDKLNAIFIELPINYQEAIEAYMTKHEIKPELEALFQGAEQEGKNIRGLLEILDKSQAGKLPVICFDSSKMPQGEYQNQANYGRFFLRGKSRDDDMLAMIQEFSQKQPGKYLLIGGENHFLPGDHPESGDSTLGQKLHGLMGPKFKALELNIDKPTETIEWK